MIPVQLLMALVFTFPTVSVAGSNLRSRRPPDYMHAKPGYHEALADGRHDMGIKKGEMLAQLHTNCTVMYNQSYYNALSVQNEAGKKVQVQQQEVSKWRAKVDSATNAETNVDPVTGESPKMIWIDKLDSAEAERNFYRQIVSNAVLVQNWALNGLSKTRILREKVENEFKNVEKYEHEVRMQALNGTSTEFESELLMKQWQDADKDYDCSQVPVVQNAETICDKANTKYGIKCPITCMEGYDDLNATVNTLRCRKQGKFGRQLYGEFEGMAACVGKMCGKPAEIEKAQTVNRMIRYPQVATYNCFEGYSQDGNARGAKLFNVPCGMMGHFEQSISHTCKRVKCGSAPTVKFAKPISGDFFFSDSITYTCNSGYTLDETAGGLKSFSVSCQATGEFSVGQLCKPVRCGPPLEYDNTAIRSEPGEKYFSDEVDYECEEGYSIDQKPNGMKKFVMECTELGGLRVKGAATDRPAPQCRPISAGISPHVLHGNAKPREMFYGESLIVTADDGYSTTGIPGKGVSFVLTVTKHGTFDGLDKFLPIKCGAPPSVKHGTTTFKPSAVFGDLLSYSCDDGYSTDRSSDLGARSFSIQCEADADFSKVPNLGYCANIDDCDGHTCGPHGECVDHLDNYTCDCQHGYAQTLDANTSELVCGNINDCGEEACGVGECKDLVNDYRCLCPFGYEQVGEGKEKTCGPKICGIPPEVANAATEPFEVADQKASYKDVILYQCGIGYTTSGRVGGKNHFSIECKADRQFTAVQECKAVDCGGVPQVEFGSASLASATFSQSVHYTCKDGYTIDGTPQGDAGFHISCLANGQYSDVSRCRPVNCGEPDEIQSASRPAGSLVFKQSATYKCFEGYTLNGYRDGPTEFSVECYADGSLDRLKTCLPKVCGEPPLVIDAMFATTQDEGQVAYPRVTQVTCHDGYTVDGSAGGANSFNVACLSTGFFEAYDKHECQPVNCGPLPELSNATFDHIKPDSTVPGGHQGLNFAEKAFYKCLPGFSAGGEPEAPALFKVECLPSGQFSAPPPDMQCRNINDCERHTCGPKGRCIDLIGPSPAYTCLCEHGFELMTKPDGEKHCGNTDDCKGQYCGVGTCRDLIGDYTCVCPEGYSIDSPTGSKTCVPVKCAADAPSVENGKQVSQHSGIVEFPTTLRYECDAGYSIDGSVVASAREFQVHCKPSAQLSGMMSCQKISCGAPSVLSFTTLVHPETPRHSVEYGGTAAYKCFEGYSVGGMPGARTEFTVTCQDSGVLTDPGVCEPVRCGKAPRIEHARAGIAGDVFFGMQLVYSCDLGYTLDGSPSGGTTFEQQCLKDGHFSALAQGLVCKPIDIGKAPVLENAVMTSIAGQPVIPLEQIQRPLLNPGSTIAIKGGQHGKWCADEGNAIRCNRNGISAWEQFTVLDAGDGRIGLRGGRWGKICKGGRWGIKCSKDTMRSREKFTVEDVGNGQFALRGGRRGKYCSDRGRRGVKCSKGAARSWESFTARCLSGCWEPPVPRFDNEMYYPLGIEYRCGDGYTENGSPGGPVKISARVNSVGGFTPALPTGCLPITYTIHGKVKNAVNGLPLQASIHVAGTNTTVQTKNGFFEIKDARPGLTTLEYDRTGFIKTTRVLEVVGNVNVGGLADISMSPKMRKDEWRAVVTWGLKPTDLDTYVKWGYGKVFWAKKKRAWGDEAAVLEVDDTRSWGPETLYLGGIGKCRKRWGCDIKYVINDYTKSGNMKDVSDAQVTLYTGERVAGSWKIKDCASSVTRRGNWWHVFTIDGRTNRLKWSCRSPSLAQNGVGAISSSNSTKLASNSDKAFS